MAIIFRLEGLCKLADGYRADQLELELAQDHTVEKAVAQQTLHLFIAFQNG
jgi:hypothetical protein